MVFRLAETIQSVGLELRGVLAYYPDGSFLVHDESEFLVIDGSSVRRRFGRSPNRLNATLDEVVAKLGLNERIAAGEPQEKGQYLLDFSATEVQAERIMGALQHYFQHSRKYERMGWAKITENGRLVAVYDGHRVPEKMRFHWGEDWPLPHMDVSNQINTRRNRLWPEYTKTVKVFDREVETLCLSYEDLQNRGIAGISDLTISPDGKIFVVNRDLRQPYDKEYEDSEFGTVQVLGSDWNYLWHFGNRPQDIQNYGGLKEPYRIASLGENLLVAGSEPGLCLFAPGGTLVEQVETELEDFDFFIEPSYIGVTGLREDVQQETYKEKRGPFGIRTATVAVPVRCQVKVGQIWRQDLTNTGIEKTIIDPSVFGRIYSMAFYGNNFLVLIDTSTYSKDARHPSFEIQRYMVTL